MNVLNKRIPDSLEAPPFEVNALVEHATVSDGTTVAVELNGLANSFAWHMDGLKRDTNDYEIDGFANEMESENKGRLRNSDARRRPVAETVLFLTDVLFLFSSGPISSSNLHRQCRNQAAMIGRNENGSARRIELGCSQVSKRDLLLGQSCAEQVAIPNR